MARLGCILIACLLLFDALSAAAADLTRDVPFGSFWDDAIVSLQDKGVIVGYPDETFRRDRSMSRYEFAAAWARLVDLLGLPRPEFSLDATQTDVPEGHWARGAVERLAGLKIVPALPFDDMDPLHWAAFSVRRLDGILTEDKPEHLAFRGDRALRRGQCAEVVYRTLRVGAEQGLGPKLPEDLVTKTPAQVMLDMQLFVGYPDETLRLDRAMTRIEFAIVTARFADKWAMPPPQ